VGSLVFVAVLAVVGVDSGAIAPHQETIRVTSMNTNHIDLVNWITILPPLGIEQTAFTLHTYAANPKYSHPKQFQI
jgi:hypothetical protein